MQTQIHSDVGLRALGLLSIAAFVNQGLVSAQEQVRPESAQIGQNMDLPPLGMHRDRAMLVDGSTIEGELASKNQEFVLFLRSDQTVLAIPVNKILKLRIEDTRSAAPRTVTGGVMVTLEDGSRLRFSHLKTENGVFSAEFDTTEKVSFARTLCRSIRFGSNPEHDLAWSDFVDSGPKTSDVLAVRKPGGVVDFIEVEVRSLSEEALTVSLDGQDLPVPLSRIEGVVFRSRAHRIPAAVAVISYADQKIVASDFTATPDEISIHTSAGMLITLPRREFEVDYAPTHVRTLSDLEPKVVRWDPLRGQESGSFLPALLRPQSGPVFERRESSGADQIAVTELRGALELAIPLRREFGWIHGRALSAASDVSTVVFRGDDRELMRLHQSDLVGSGRQFSIPVTDVRGLVIDVESAALVTFEDLIFVKTK